MDTIKKPHTLVDVKVRQSSALKLNRELASATNGRRLLFLPCTYVTKRLDVGFNPKSTKPLFYFHMTGYG
jgi:hypothetical protein